MLPSKIKPTTWLSRLTTGLPEFPPMMSAVDAALIAVGAALLERLNGSEVLPETAKKAGRYVAFIQEIAANKNHRSGF